MYKILKSMLAEFSYFIEKHFFYIMVYIVYGRMLCDCRSRDYENC